MTEFHAASPLAKELLGYMETNHLTPQKFAIGLGVTEKELVRVLDGGRIHPSTELMFKLVKNGKVDLTEVIKINLGV